MGKTKSGKVFLSVLAFLGFVLVLCFSLFYGEIVKTVNLSIERKGHTATLLADGRVLVAGGENLTGVLAGAEIYDPSQEQFVPGFGSLMATPRAGHSATLLPDGRVFVMGGADGVPLNSTEFYVPQADVWVSGPAMGHARAGHTATALADGRIVVVGGDGEGTVEVYDPITNSFAPLSDANGPVLLGQARAFHSAISLKSGQILIVGGRNTLGAALDSAEIFDGIGLHGEDHHMVSARVKPDMRLLPDGKVQIIGGNDDAAAGTIELYDPETGVFGAQAHVLNSSNSLNEVTSAGTRAAVVNLSIQDVVLNRGGYTITEMPSLNKALLVGGVNVNGVVMKSGLLMSSSGATVTTSVLDFPAYSFVVMAGSGWTPGEMVEIKVHQEQALSPDRTVYATVDDAGNFLNTDLELDATDICASDIVTAKGPASGYVAQTSFSDSGSFDYDPKTQTLLNVVAGTSGSFIQSVTAPKNNGSFTASLQYAPTGTTPIPASWVSTAPTSLSFVTTSNAGDTKSWTVTFSVPSGTAAGSYTAQIKANASVPGVGPGPGTPVTLTVPSTKVTPDINWNNPSDITYGTALGGAQLNASATYNGNSVAGTFVYTPPAGTVLNAGPSQTLHVAFTPTDTNNYNGASKDVTINVLKATPVITWANPADITYGTALSGTQLNATASVPGVFTYTPAAGLILGAGSGQKLHVDFTPTDAVNYNSASMDVVINVTKRPITVTADAKSKTYGDSDPGLTYQITSGLLVGTDAFSGALTRATGEDVGAYAIQQGTVALNANYELSYVGANLTISKRAVTVTADAQTKVYGNDDPVPLTYKITSGSLAFSDAFTGALTRAAGQDVGTYAISQGTLALNANYDLSYVGANLTISKRAVTVTADVQSKTYGDADPALTYKITSGSLAFSDAFTGALTRVAGEPVGSYAIEQGTLALNTNYDLSYVGANLTINKRAVTVTADVQSKTYGDVDPALTYRITSGSLAFIDAFSGTLTRTAGEDVGPHAITQGTLALSDNYALTYVGANLTIKARPVTVTADAKSKVYGDADPALTYQITSGTLAFSDVFAGALTRDAGENVGTHAITQGTLALNTNYDLTYVGANLTITARPITVTADAKSKVYGNTDPALTYQITIGSLVAGDGFTGALARVAGENVGTHAITQGTLALNTNYALTYVGANLTITARPITVTADAKSKVYGDTDPALTYQITIGSLVAGDGFTGALTRAAGENVGTYAITQGTLALNANYDLSYVGGNLTISKRAVTVTADAKSKVYGDADPALTYQVTSGSLAFTDAFTGALTRGAGENVGTYAITQGTLALTSNYALTYVGANLTITPRPVTVTADAKTKVLNSADPALTYKITIGSLVTGDAFTGALTRVAGESVGSYLILQGTLALSTNYNLTYVPANFSIRYANSTENPGGHAILQPINVDGTSVFKQKSTVPAKFRVFDANGFSIGTPGVVSSFRVVQIISGTASNVDEAVDSTTPDSAFRWSPTDQLWIFNINTKNLSANNTYVYLITLNDGSTITFQFGLK